MVTIGCHSGDAARPKTTPTAHHQHTDSAVELPHPTPPLTVITGDNSTSMTGSVGSLIAFQSDRDRQDEIYVMNADGSDQRILYSNPWALDSMPSWSPEGNRIAIASRDRGKDFEILVVTLKDDLQGISEVLQLTDNDFDDRHPSWSPDGAQIAFSSKRQNQSEIYVIDIKGTAEHQLTDSHVTAKDPAWSPDGTQIAFVSGRDGDQEIFLMKSDGSDQLPLTENYANDWSPAWSPDGSQIAFISNRNGDQHLFLMNADGSNPRQLTDASSPWNDDPTWSPEGKKIAFRSNLHGFIDIYVVASDGSSHLQQLTHNAEIDQDRAPAWQPMRPSP